jgi:hypothetical protein
VFGLAASDDRLDSAFPDEPAVLVVVVAAVGDQRPRPAARPADAAADMWYAVEQLEQLGDVIAVAACCRRDRGRPGSDPFWRPFFACRWPESAIARSHSNWSNACSSASSSSWLFRS